MDWLLVILVVSLILMLWNTHLRLLIVPPLILLLLLVSELLLLVSPASTLHSVVFEPLFSLMLLLEVIVLYIGVACPFFGRRKYTYVPITRVCMPLCYLEFRPQGQIGTGCNARLEDSDPYKDPYHCGGKLYIDSPLGCLLVRIGFYLFLEHEGVH